MTVGNETSLRQRVSACHDAPEVRIAVHLRIPGPWFLFEHVIVVKLSEGHAVYALKPLVTAQRNSRSFSAAYMRLLPKI